MKRTLNISLDSLNNSRKLFLILDILKISLIIFVAFSFVVQMIPYFVGADSYVYANTAINLANTGKYGLSNELLQETGLWEFVPYSYSITVHNVAVPMQSGLAMHGLTTLAYLLGGYYGLFYLTPIFSILLIIAVDRICINLFGRFVAFVAVILTGTSWIIFKMGVQLMSESIFTFFFIIGIFFLVKFFRNKDETLILLSSAFLVTSALIRPNGIIFFPVELFLVIGFLFLPIISKSHSNIKLKATSDSFYIYYKKNQKKILRIIFFMSVPWIFFFLFNAAYNSYQFGDPSLSITEVKPPTGNLHNVKNAFNNLSLDFFQWIQYHAALMLPEKLLENLPTETDDKKNLYLMNDRWVGTISLLILFSALLVSFLTKEKRSEIIILVLFIFGISAFYSMAWISLIPSLDEYGPTDLVFTQASAIRFMIPAFPLFYMLFGFLMFKIWSVNTETILNIHFKTLAKILKFGFLVFVISFLVASFYDSSVLQGIINNNFVNPQEELEKHFPIDLEGLPEKKIITGGFERKIMQHGAIQFFPYTGFNFWRINYQLESIPQEPIQTLKELLKGKTTTGPSSILNEGYEVFVFKQHRSFDTTYYHYLEKNHGIILKDYSKSFCKMELVNELKLNNNESKPDKICY